MEPTKLQFKYKPTSTETKKNKGRRKKNLTLELPVETEPTENPTTTTQTLERDGFVLKPKKPNLSVENNALVENIQLKMKTLLRSPTSFLEGIQDPLRPFLQVGEPRIDMISYGIGDIDTSNRSQFQYALLILLARFFKEVSGSQVWIYTYDPIPPSPQVLNLFAKDGVQLIEKDEQGIRPITNPTLFYLPHAPLTLHNNVLKSNWDINSLNRMVLLSNNLESYKLKLPKLKLQAKAWYINQVQSDEVQLVTRELPEFEPLPNTFNDMAVHSFNPVKDTLAPKNAQVEGE